MYALGDNNYQYALLLDNVYKQTWDMMQDPFQVSMWGDQIRFYIIAGDSLPALRTSFMDLAGKPLVPPRRVFGFWTGEYNLYYDSNMMFDKIKGMQDKNFPMDGIMLDVQWFGGVYENSDDSPMGSLRFGSKFLNGRSVGDLLKDLDSRGIGVIPIEESYVAKNDPISNVMAQSCYFAKYSYDSCNPVYFNAKDGDNCWWGNGYMIDWTNGAGAAMWHDKKRQELVNYAVVGHVCNKQQEQNL